MKTKLTLLAAAILLATPALFAQQPALPLRSPPSLPLRPVAPAAADPGAEQYQVMLKQLTLTPDEQTKIKDILDKMDEALKDNADKTAEAQASVQTVKDQQARMKAYQDMSTLRQDRAKIQADAQAEALKILTPDQRGDWTGYQVRQFITPRLQTVGELTAKQQTQLDALCQAAGKELAAAADPTSNEVRTPAYGKLWRQILTTVLTDEQTALFFNGGGMYGEISRSIAHPPIIAKPLPQPLDDSIKGGPANNVAPPANVPPGPPMKQPPVRLREIEGAGN